MKNLLIVVADSNDADYVYNITEVSNETLDKINIILEKMKPKKTHFGYPWGKGESRDSDRYEFIYDGILTEEEMEYIDGFIPYGECGVHTLSDVGVYRNICDKEELGI